MQFDEFSDVLKEAEGLDDDHDEPDELFDDAADDGNKVDGEPE